MPIYCSICKKYAKLHSAKEDFAGNLKEVKAKCKKHGIVDADYDCYEDIVGYPEDY